MTDALEEYRNQVQTAHTEHDIDIKISNDNTKGEKRATIHVRTDGLAEDAIKLAIKLFKESTA